MENLTIEQAFNNIALAIEQFKGTRQEHIIIEHSMIKIKEFINPTKITDDLSVKYKDKE